MSVPLVLQGNIGDKEIYYTHLSDEVRALLSGSTIHLFEAENKDTVAVLSGMPAARHSSGSGIIIAQSEGVSLAAVGLIVTGADPGFISVLQTIGRLTLSDWSAVTGTSSLSPLATYFLSDTAGMLTTTPPTGAGTVTQRIGMALAAQTLEICVDAPIRN